MKENFNAKFNNHTYLLSRISILFEVLSIDFDLSFVHGIKSEFLENSTSDEETGAVSGGVVGQTNGDSVTGKLVGVSGRNDNISDQSGVCDLGDDVLKFKFKFKSSVSKNGSKIV